MEDKLYDYWVAKLQNGYIGNLIKITKLAGSAADLYGLIEKYAKGESIEKYLYMFNDENGRVMLTKRLCDHMANRFETFEEIEKNYYNMLDAGITYVNYDDKTFPQKLLNIQSPPYGLFYKGRLPDENKKSVAIVGSRECSEYGRSCAEYFGANLAKEDIQIISGMAWGIDGVSQLAAIKAGGNSYGVLGCGVDVVYPRKNCGLYNLLCENGNGVISEYDPKLQAKSNLFPPRNRIISGLCDLLLVVEARARSGTLITVNMAIEQGRSVMAVPGRITDELSRGCLMLNSLGAAPAINLDSVLAELGVNKKADDCFGDKERERATLRDEEKTILDKISYDPLDANQLSMTCNMSVSDILIILSKLEIAGRIKEVAQGKFVINS